MDVKRTNEHVGSLSISTSVVEKIAKLIKFVKEITKQDKT